MWRSLGFGGIAGILTYFLGASLLRARALDAATYRPTRRESVGALSVALVVAALVTWWADSRGYTTPCAKNTAVDAAIRAFW